jgi:cellulose synthase/poly-beta-1,6-N-acetylglucosamine synthase-like glycosyltransferase/peptidoglycan/xylan/chitin deacetylase (PgdA/CDA1 family)
VTSPPAKPGQRKRQQAIRSHWVVLAAVVFAVALALLVQGYTHHLAGIGDDSLTASGSAANVPSAVEHGGPVVDARAGQPRTAGPREGTIALTFDDGPDPTWTPKILAVLRKHHVHATFFVVGTAVIAHPEIARQIVDDGNELGVHTLTHVDLGTAPEWRRQLETQTAQQAIIDATGKATALLRPPYSSENDAVTDNGWSAIRGAAQHGYLTVLTTKDAEDWRRPGVPAIERNLTPTGTAGQILLMHDGGGDRSQTVAALDAALSTLATRGYRVTTVADSVGLGQTMHAASAVERFDAAATVWGIRLSDLVVTLITWALVLSGIVMLIRAVLVVTVAAGHHRRSRRGRHHPDGPALPPVTERVTVIVPAYNEAAGIEAAVRSIAASTHPVEIIVVDDGSTDDTAGIVEALNLPGVRLIRQPNGGKPTALNTGIQAASHDLIVMVDGDTVFEPDTVRALIQPFADPRIGAVSGNTKINNRGGILGAWQHIEYVVGFNLDRRLFDVAECMPTVPGAIGAFRKDALTRVGGVSTDTLAEDTDLTMALSRDGWRIVYRDDARAWTEAPASLGALWRQRYRWCYGTMQAMWKHRGAVLQRGPAGKLGRRGLGYLLVLQVLLPLFAPIVDVFAVYGLIFLDPVRIIGLWSAFLLVQVLMAAYAFHIDKEKMRPLWTLPLQQVVYRQLMYLVVIQSVFTAFAGIRVRWQRMERYGTLKAPMEPAPTEDCAASRIA